LKSSRTKSRKRLWLYLAVGAVVLVAGSIFAVHTLAGSPPLDASQLGTAETGDIARSVVATGKVWPITQVEVKSKASGIVTQLDTDINHPVHKGEVLAQLDQQEILDQVAAAKAQLAAAESNARSAEAAVAYDKVAAQAPDLPDYERAYNRAAQMEKDGVLSKQNMDQAEQQYRAAANTRDRAVAQISVDKAREHQALAQVAQAQASLKQLEEQLSYTTVTSPIDGVVLSRDVQVGDAVSSILVLGSTATLVMTLGDTHQVYVKGKVDESDIAQGLHGPARAHQGPELPRPQLRRHRHKDCAAGRGEGQRHYLRGADLDRQSRRRTQSQHDRQRRDRPRRAQERAHRSGAGRDL
jgi:HlyD family secretion protein